MTASRRVIVGSVALAAIVLALALDRVWFSFTTFGAVSKQTDCKTQLATMLAQQQRAEAGAPRASNSVLLTSDPSRYGFFGGAQSYVPPDPRYLPHTIWTGPFPLPSGAVPGWSDAGVVLVCAGDIDADEGIDIWSVADFPREVERRIVPAAVPLHEISDVPRYRLPVVRWFAPPPADEVVLSTK